MSLSPSRAALLALTLLLASACGGDEETASSTGPAAVPVGTLEVFTEMPGNSEGLAMGKDADGADTLYVGSADGLHRVSSSGEVTQVATGLAPVGVTARAGDVLVCGKEGGTGVLWSVSPTGDKTVLVGPGAFTYEVVNFVAVAPDGSLVFSDSAANKVYRADADGGAVAPVTDAITYPNGLSFSPDGATLYVASWDGAKVHAIARDAAGQYGAPTVLADGVENVDGLVTLVDGDLVLVQSGAGVVHHGVADGSSVTLAPGQSLGLPANAAFGRGAYGEGWLYVTNLFSRSLSRISVEERGIDLLAP